MMVLVMSQLDCACLSAYSRTRWTGEFLESQGMKNIKPIMFDDRKVSARNLSLYLHSITAAGRAVAMDEILRQSHI